ncbi:substrate-binding domain-containing protein [uncultured Oscillibacter sp.]|uniref:sugar ABC transporter substrate-binding protein n=2 Tax=uncultured Oscillibacter sp. TaxID=876091 RepID=UPI0026029BD3|nr:substrate-binding domain-containing protein [uncultured Oscillibacter sp.]
MKLKRLLTMLTVFAMAAVLAGCATSAPAAGSQGGSSEKQDSGSDAAGKTYKIAYVVRDSGSIYSQYITDFNEACEALGVEPVIISYENDTAKWPDALENAVTMGCDAVYSWPDDQAMADYAGSYYKQQGIPHCSMGIDSADADFTLLGDQVAMGNALGEQVAAWVEANLGDEPFEWALLEYTSAEHVAARSQAMEDKVTELCPNGTQVAALEAQTLDEGMNQTENLLQLHPNVQVLVCCEDTAAMGAVEVFRAAGKTGDQYAIFGACFGDQVGNAIIRGDVYRESIAFDKFGPDVVENLVKLIEGETVEHEVYGGFIPVTAENVREVMEMFDYEVIE